MKIDMICVGKLKEGYLRAAEAEYRKRLTPYVKLAVYETPESDISKECAGITKLLAARPNSYKAALAIEGRALTSPAFAKTLENLAINGTSNIVFIIGGPTGLAGEVLHACHARISLSAMTFTHQFARVLLLEQIYRAYTIINNTPYHK